MRSCRFPSFFTFKLTKTNDGCRANHNLSQTSVTSSMIPRTFVLQNTENLDKVKSGLSTATISSVFTHLKFPMETSAWIQVSRKECMIICENVTLLMLTFSLSATNHHASGIMFTPLLQSFRCTMSIEAETLETFFSWITLKKESIQLVWVRIFKVGYRRSVQFYPHTLKIVGAPRRVSRAAEPMQSPGFAKNWQPLNNNRVIHRTSRRRHRRRRLHLAIKPADTAGNCDQK